MRDDIQLDYFVETYDQHIQEREDRLSKKRIRNLILMAIAILMWVLRLLEVI